MRVINKYISFSDEVQNESAEIYIYGDISDEKWWDSDVTPKEIRDTLDSFGSVKSVDIHINSCGGSCIAGNAIISILDNYRRKNNATLNVYIEGIAASMGSGIASVGDKVYMADNALAMYHKPLTLAYGNADELQKAIELLEKVEETLLMNYMRKFKGTEDELRQLLADETWLTAEEAKEYGFVDEIIAGVQVAASSKGIKIGNQVFNSKVSDLIKDKLPQIKIEKEEKQLEYNEKLKDFGVSKDFFDTLNLDAEKVLEMANIVKDATMPEPVEQFIEKENALATLGCEDITSEQLLDYAKAGMNPVDTTEISNKASAYDKIVDSAKEVALVNAMKAQGDTYDETRMKKFLDILTYDEIVDQSKAWETEAKKELHAGERISEKENVDNKADKKEKVEDFKF